MRKCCANCANGLQNCKSNEKDPSRCEMFCQSGNYGGFIPMEENEEDENKPDCGFWCDECSVENCSYRKFA